MKNATTLKKAKRKLTPKQRVLRKWPDATALRCAGGWGIIRSLSVSWISDDYFSTPSSAWHDASRSM